jgi:hypothetical protein
MTQRSLFWDGVALGDCGPYTSAHFHDRLLRSITGCTGDLGVLVNWLDGLEVTGGTSPINVASGAAIVYGTFFESDTAVSLAVSTPAEGYSRYDIVVVRRDASTQTARIGLVQGVGGGGVPTLTQDPEGTYEIPLAQLYISDAGVITVADLREFAYYSAGLATIVIETQHIPDGAVTAAKMVDQTRWELRGAGQIEPDATNACTWTVGVNYDFWAFATAVTNEGWVYFMAPTGLVPGTLAFYLWTAPDVAAAGNVKWDYNVYYGVPNQGALTNATGSILIAQGGRAIANSYRDAFFTITTLVVAEGQIIALQVKRDGGHGTDTYGSSARLLGVEMEWTADA